MKRILALIVLFGIAVLPLASCSSQKTSDTPAESSASSDTAENIESSQSTAITTEEPVEGELTLEAVKKAALDAGYAAEDMQEILQDLVPSPVKGIFVNYQDENYQSQSPVYEFKSPEEAQEFARLVNDDGYSLPIVNGKLLAVTSSMYGIVLNEKEKSALETLLKSKVMDYVEPAQPVVNEDKDYAGACTRIDAVCNALNKLIGKSVLLYTKSLPEGDPNLGIAYVSFSILSSADMGFTSALSEDQVQMDLVVKTWELYGCTDVELKHNAANDYTMTGKRAGFDETFTLNCIYSADKDSLRILDKNGNEVVELLEYIPLGGDKYAFQTLYERGIVEYKDGKIFSLTYSLANRTVETAYEPDTDSIYPDGTGIDTAWVYKLGEDAYEQYITFDGEKLKISAMDFSGNKLNLEISGNFTLSR